MRGLYVWAGGLCGCSIFIYIKRWEIPPKVSSSIICEGGGDE